LCVGGKSDWDDFVENDPGPQLKVILTKFAVLIPNKGDNHIRHVQHNCENKVDFDPQNKICIFGTDTAKGTRDLS